MKRKIILIAYLSILLFAACNPEGGMPQPDIKDILPRVSPDGKKIVFTRIHSTSTKPGIYVMDIDGKNLKNIYSNQDNNNNFSLISASWSPNSENLAYIKQDKTLVIVNLSGEVLQSVKMEFTDYFRSIPYWSKDGKFILCTHFDLNKTLPIVTLVTNDLQHQRKIQLPDTEKDIKGLVSLSFDNEELLFGTDNEIFITDLSSNIINNIKINGFNLWYSSPEWNASQTKIMYMSNSGKIKLINLQDKKETVLLENALTPSFTPDGKSVIFIRPDKIWINEKIWIKNLITNEEYSINY